MKPITVKWFKYLVAILLGNGLYFALNPTCRSRQASHLQA